MYDKQILNSIAKQYKTVRQICDETGFSRSRVGVRMRQLKKHELIDSIQGVQGNGNALVMKYRKKSHV